MNKALRFVWLSLLTLFCGVASAGTVVFDPATDASSGTSLTKDGVTITMTSGTSSFAATDYNGTLSYAFAKSTGFEISNQEPAGNITAVTFEFQSTGGYIFDRSYKLATTEVEGGWKYAVPDATGSSSLSFSVYSGPIYISRITVEYIDGTGGGGGGEVGTTYSINDLMTGAADVASATLKFTDAQVVYGDGTNYIVREGGKAIDLMGTSLSLEKGATLNGTVTMNVTYKNGFLKAEDVAGVTNGNNLTQTNATGENVPVTTTIDQLASNYKGDLVLLSQVTIYNDATGDLGQGAAYYARTGFNFATLTNIADFLDKVSADQDATYDIVAWYNEPGAGAIKAKLQIVEFLGGEVAKPAAPVISGNQNFTGSTDVTITAEEGATIFYTTDGTAPTSWDPAYTAPFTITETTTVKAVARVNDIYSDVAEMTFTKEESGVTGSTIADLATAAKSQDNVTLVLNNAKVVYAQGNNYILREDGKAIDLLNTSLSLTQGTTVSGHVQVNVTYTSGILSTSDIEGVTTDANLTATGVAGDMDPIEVDLIDVKLHKGDLLNLKDVEVWTYRGTTSIYTNTPSYIELKVTNAEDFDLESGFYNLTIWYNDASSDYYAGKVKVIKAERVDKRPDAPVILGEEEFVGKTTVSIAATEGLNVYYTLDGTDPTRQSTVYTEPFTITETTTVKAVTAYLDDYSDIVTKTFTKVGDFETKTIAQLFEGQQAVENVTISLNNAKVVYTEKHEDGTKVAILRENGQALDVISGVLDLPLGSTVTGTFFASVDFNGGIFTTRDVQGETNSYELEYTMPSDEGYNDPIETTVADVHLYPGDLVSIKGLQVLGQDGQYYGFTEDYSFVNLTDNDELANTVSGQKYTVLGWFNAPGTGFADGNASLKAVKLTAEDATKYHNQTIAELNVRRDREDNIRLVLDNAKVVYVRANPYYGTKDIALRQDGKAVVLYNSSLPLELNSTVSGTVKLDFYALAGIPQLREIDGGVTTADSLNITAGASQEVDPVEVTMADYDEHRADVIVLRQVKIVYGSQAAYAIEKDGQKIAFKNENEDVDVDALVSNDNLYDVVLWYNGYINEAPEMEFVKAVKVTDVGIYGVEGNFGKDGNTYNLQGVKVGENYRGVVIRDGKKFTKK